MEQNNKIAASAPADTIVANKIIKVFASYCWHFRKEAVRQMVRELRDTEGYEVWLDIWKVNHSKHKDLSDIIIEAIKEADVFLFFYSESYSKSKNCMRELKCADGYNKKMIPINVQEGYKLDQNILWFIQEDVRLQFFDGGNFETDKRNICDRIKALTGGNCDELSKLNRGQYSSNKNFKFFGVPEFRSNYFQRETVADKIVEQIKPVTNGGTVVIHGEGGVGKTTLMSAIIRDPKRKEFFCNDCGIHRIFWINCYQWRNTFDKNAFLQKICDFAEKSGFKFNKDDDSVAKRFMTLVRDYNDKGLKCAYVLDDMFNGKIAESIFDEHQDTCPAICIAITRDLQKIKRNKCSMITKIHIDELSDNDIKTVLKNSIKENSLSEEQLQTLVQICSGLPLTASLIAGHFNWERADTVLEAYNALVKNPSAELRSQHAEHQDKDKSHSPISIYQVMSISLNLMPERERLHYFAFLLFDPNEPVRSEDVDVLWRLKDQSKRLCEMFEQRSLLRRVDRDGSIQQVRRSRRNVKNGFLVHQMLFNAVCEIASKDLCLPENLTAEEKLHLIRMKLITGGWQHHNGSGDTAEPSILAYCLNKDNAFVAERIVMLLPVEDLFEFCIERSPRLTKDQPFVNYVLHHGSRYAPRLVNIIVSKIEKNAPEMMWNVISQLGPIDANDKLGIPGCFINSLLHDNKISHRYESIAKLLAKLRDRGRSFIEELLNEHCNKSDPLILAAVEGKVQEVHRLLDNSDYSGKLKLKAAAWALRLACRKGYVAIVKAIVEKCPTAKDFKFEPNPILRGMNYTSTTVASRYGEIEILKILIKGDDNRSPVDIVGLFNYASKYGNLECVKYLDEEAFPDWPENLQIFDGSTGISTDFHPIVGAIEGDHLQICDYLLEKHPEMATVEVFTSAIKVSIEPSVTVEFLEKILTSLQQRKAIFEAAISCEQLASVKYLTKTFEGQGMEFKKWPYLLLAVKIGNLDIVKFLDDKGFPTVEKDELGNILNTVLHAAADGGKETCNSRFECLKFFIEKEPELVNVTTNNGSTVLHAAAASRCCHSDFVKFVMQHGPNIAENTDEDGMTVLHLAAICGRWFLANFLLKQAPCLINCISNKGETALHLASRFGHASIVKLLMKKEPELVHRTDNNGLKALDEANRCADDRRKTATKRALSEGEVVIDCGKRKMCQSEEDSESTQVKANIETPNFEN